MALSLPTTSNTPGSFSNTALSANLLSSIVFTSDFKFSNTAYYGSPAARDLEFGGSCFISANGDYAAIQTDAAASGDSDNIGGIVLVMARSGNTWTQQAALTNQSSDSGSARDLYGNWEGGVWDKSISIDGAGETIMVGGNNRGYLSSAGRIEIWERSGSTWSMNYGLNGTSGQAFGNHVAMLSHDGNSAIVVGHSTNTIHRLIKTGGTWGVDSTHGSYTVGSDYTSGGSKYAYNYDGTKIIYAGGSNQATETAQIKLATRYYDGSAWQNVEKNIDLSGVSITTPYVATCTMSQDGNYAFLGGQLQIAGGGTWIAILSWDSSSNNWTQDTVFEPLSGISSPGSNQPGRSGPILTNYTGTKLVAMNRPDYSASPDRGMYAWERSGSSWTLVGKFSEGGNLNQTSYSSGALSADGFHLLHGIARGHLAAPWQIGKVYYWVPTGITQSSVSNGQIATHQGRRFRYNSAKGRWTPANKVNLTGVATTRTRSAGVASSSLSGETLSINGLTVDVGEFAGKTTTYANASIFPFSSLQAGDQAIALDTGYLYVTDGSGWFRVANSAIVT